MKINQEKKKEIERLLRWWTTPHWLHQKEEEAKSFTREEGIQKMEHTSRITVKDIANRIFEIIEK